MSGGGRRFHGTAPVLTICVPILALCGSALLFAPSDKLGTPLTVLLALCAVVGTRVSFDIEGTLFWDGSFLPIVCAATLLGPLPTVAITVLSELAVWQAERYRMRVLPLNLVGTIVPNLMAASVIASVSGGLADAPFYALLAAVVCASIALNAALITVLAGVLYDAPIIERFRRHRGIAAPVAVNVVLAMGAVTVYRAEGLAATAFVIAGVFVFAFVANRLRADREQRLQITELARSRGRLVAQLLEAEDRERRALADAIHDSLVQTLLAARQDLAEGTEDGPFDRNRLQDQLDEAIRQARQVIRATHPSILDRVGLEAGVRAIADDASTRGGFDVALNLGRDIAGVHDRILFSAVRELLVNAVKHSRATSVEVSIHRRDDDVWLIARDDGVGFHLADPMSLVERGHIGLQSLVERVEAVGGAVTFEDGLPGARIVVVLPALRPDPSPREQWPAALARVGQD